MWPLSAERVKKFTAASALRRCDLSRRRCARRAACAIHTASDRVVFADPAASLHRDEKVVRAEHQVSDLIRNLLVDAAAAGEVRDDVAPSELAEYCLHALAAAGRLQSKAAIRRLVMVTLAGLRPPPAPASP